MPSTRNEKKLRARHTILKNEADAQLPRVAETVGLYRLLLTAPGLQRALIRDVGKPSVVQHELQVGEVGGEGSGGGHLGYMDLQVEAEAKVFHELCTRSDAS